MSTSGDVVLAELHHLACPLQIVALSMPSSKIREIQVRCIYCSCFTPRSH